MNLWTELSQKQTINQQMLQSIRILQMGSQELTRYLEELCLENPVLELDLPDDTHEMEQNYEYQLYLQRNLDWLVDTDRQNKIYYESDTDNGSGLWKDPRETQETLADFLHSQILTRKYSALEEALIDFLIDSLDPHGYLTETAQSIAALLLIPEPLAQRMIEELKSLDPPGIGASDLTECLLIQVNRLEAANGLPSDVPPEAIRGIICSHLFDIGRSHFHKVMQAMKLPQKEFDRCYAFLRTLSPYPADSFATRDYVQYITPDISILNLDGHLEIVANDTGFNRFHANPFYVNLNEETKDPRLKQYLQEKLRQIEHVKRDISQRASTILRIAQVLTARQKKFFYQGPGNRLPLNLKDIADELNLHESTISRALQDKYLQCQWGIFPLNYFLSPAAVSSPSDENSLTREHIEQKIRDLIAQEDKKKPLSDQAISNLLSQNGVQISRRTVNKYRTEMRIPDKSGRKNIL